MKVMFLSGAGGVGKTSVCNLLAETPGLKVKPSTTRDSYARLGLKDEHTARNLDKDKQVELQIQIAKDYKASLRDFIPECLDNGVSVAIIDRSPMDYAAYLFSLAPWLSMSYINARMYEDLSVFKQVELMTKQKSRVMYFPFPVWWEQQDDGVREVQDAKNFTWSCVLQHLLSQVPQQVAVTRSLPKTQTTPKERAEYCLQTMGITWTGSSTAA